MRRLKASLNNTTRCAEVEALYRAELSYTYELNIMGVASDGRMDFVAGRRSGYTG
jgi:enoyl-CoA hydratase